MPQRIGHDEAFKWVVSGTLLMFALTSHNLVLACFAVALAVLNMHVMLLWGAFVGSLFAAVCSIIGGLMVLLPLQYFPAKDVNDKRTNRMRIIVIGTLWIMFSWGYLFDRFGAFLRVLFTILTTLLAVCFSSLSFRLRGFFAKHVIANLLLPATSAHKMEVMMPNGQRVRTGQAIAYIRANAFSSTGDTNANGEHAAMWKNVKLAGPGSTVRIDGAYKVHPKQANLPPEEQRWILWFLGNGELYEMMLQDFHTLSDVSGMNMFVFNYRGVSNSEGVLEKAYDLVDDGRICLEFITSSLAARPDYVILFGHSIGGAVAARLRADHSPNGPLVLDRTFSSLGAAAHSIFGNLCLAIIGFELKYVPKFVVVGLLSSVFKGDMDVVRAWYDVTGPRLVLYHLEDAVLNYMKASLHHALDRRGSIQDSEAVKLGLDGEAGQGNHHNLPIERFPEFETIVINMRKMVGLSTEQGLQDISASVSGGSPYGQSVHGSPGSLAAAFGGGHGPHCQHAHQHPPR
eukprot:m.438234 g.438234  ORF g.438234 m.438234 type:complete len:514 (+) comp21441_c0_seq3:335-1876(+)